MTPAIITTMIILLALDIGIVVETLRIASAFRKGRMLNACHGYGSDAMSQTGVSVVVAGLEHIEDIERRLSSEYWRYEVVVVVDSSRGAMNLAALRRKYAMIRVNYPAATDLSIDGCAALYRSRQRRYRRLIIVDREHRSLGDDLNCGVEVASYEQIVPLERETFLTDGALPRLVTELQEDGHRPCDAISAPVMPLELFGRQRVAMIRRESIIEAGGFGGKRPIDDMLASMHRKHICEPIAVVRSPARRSDNPLRRLLVFLSAACTVLLFACMARQNWEETRTVMMLLLAVYVSGTFAAAMALRIRTITDPQYSVSPLRAIRKVLRCSIKVY